MGKGQESATEALARPNPHTLAVPAGGRVDGQTLVGNAAMLLRMQARQAAAGAGAAGRAEPAGLAAAGGLGAAGTARARAAGTGSSSSGTAPTVQANTSSSGAQGTGTSSTGAAEEEATPAAGGGGTDHILDEYQVREDQMTTWTPALVGWLMDEPVRMTQTEARLLDQLQWNQGLMGLYDFKRCKEEAYEISEGRYPTLPGDDSHRDAFRHIYWNVLMTLRLGENFARAFATAHEGVPGNEADREAMDLYNNELGRRIARENPNASLEELQDIVAEAIRNGEALVIDAGGNLVFSDQAAEGETGHADDAPRDGGAAPPEWTGS